MVVPEPDLLLLLAKAESPIMAMKAASAPMVAKILSFVMMYSIIRIFQNGLSDPVSNLSRSSPSLHSGIRGGLLPCFQPGLSLLIVGVLPTRFYVTGVLWGCVTKVCRRYSRLKY